MAMVVVESNSNSFIFAMYSIKRALTVLCHLDLQVITGVLSYPP
jgi:hypothetical protein